MEGKVSGAEIVVKLYHVYESVKQATTFLLSTQVNKQLS